MLGTITYQYHSGKVLKNKCPETGQRHAIATHCTTVGKDGGDPGSDDRLLTFLVGHQDKQVHVADKCELGVYCWLIDADSVSHNDRRPSGLETANKFPVGEYETTPEVAILNPTCRPLPSDMTPQRTYYYCLDGAAAGVSILKGGAISFYFAVALFILFKTIGQSRSKPTSWIIATKYMLENTLRGNKTFPYFANKSVLV